MDCFIASHSEKADSLDEIAQTIEEAKVGSQRKTRGRARGLTKRGSKSERSSRSREIKNSPYKSFKEQLRKRVLGQVKTKIARTQILQKCTQKENIENHRQWFAKRFPKVDWPLMKALCEKKKKDFHTSIENRWSDMRISLALSSANPDQVVTSRPHLSFPLSHEVSEFGSMPKLTKEEQRKAKERWAEHLSKTPLDKLSPGQLKDQFMEGKALKSISTKDLREMRKATRELNKESRDSYRKHLDEMPLLGYMKTGDPNNKEEMGEAFSKYMGHLDDLLEKVESEDVDMALLLSFEPLVEGLLKDNNSYCLVAEGARLGAERDESLKKWGLVTAGVVAAVPCFMSGPPGMALCLGAGLAVGATGYSMAKGKTKEGLERFLTGREFETLASLSEKDSEAFWELVLLPTATWGTTAGAAQTIKQLFKKGAALQSKKQASAGDDITRRAIETTKNINPDDIHITKIRHNADTQTDIFQVQFISSNNSKVKFNLEIPSELLEKKRLETEKMIKDLLEAGEIGSEEVDDLRKRWSLLSEIQQVVSKMSKESFKGLKSIRLSNFKSEIRDFRGAVKLHQVAPRTANIRRGKIVEQYVFYKLHPRLLINTSIVDTYLKITKQTPTDMMLTNLRLDDIPSPLGEGSSLTQTLAHELGHVVAYSRFGDSNPGKSWMEAVKKDGTSVSKYGDTSIKEDFAEAMKVFIQTDGGTKNPQAMKDFAHRFEILDNLMRTSMRERKSIFDRFRKRMEEKGIGFVVSAGMLTHIVMKGQIYIIPPSDDR